MTGEDKKGKKTWKTCGKIEFDNNVSVFIRLKNKYSYRYRYLMNVTN